MTFGLDEESHGMLEAVLWPFRRPGEFSRMWWLLFVDYFPVLNLLVLRGWRLAVVRRIGLGMAPPLSPSMDEIPLFIWKGAILWTMTGIYALVPPVVARLMGWEGIMDMIGDVQEFGRIVGGTSAQTMPEFLANEFADSLKVVAVEIVWLWVSSPIYRVAMVRYAVTGRLLSFARWPSNTFFALRNSGFFVRAWFFSLLLSVLLAFLSGALLVTGVGALIIPLVSLPLYYWSTAFEYGELAHKLSVDLGLYGREAQGSSLELAPVGANLVE